MTTQPVSSEQMSEEQPQETTTNWLGLFDSQWMNIVNHGHCWENYSKEDAVHEAVKMTEAKLKENNTSQQAVAAISEPNLIDFHNGDATMWVESGKVKSEWNQPVAIPAMTDQLIRPLQWIDPNPTDRYPTWRARVHHIRFEATIDTSEPTMYGKFPLSINGHDSGQKFESAEDAKAYAQANYEKRVVEFMNYALLASQPSAQPSDTDNEKNLANFETLLHTLEIIGVGDADNAQECAGDALVSIGYWEKKHVAAPQVAQPSAEAIRDDFNWKPEDLAANLELRLPCDAWVKSGFTIDGLQLWRSEVVAIINCLRHASSQPIEARETVAGAQGDCDVPKLFDRWLELRAGKWTADMNPLQAAFQAGFDAFRALASAQPIEQKPVACLGWSVRERRSADGELLDCFVEAPREGNMAYALEVLGDDYTGYGDVERKLEHCKLIVSLVNNAPQPSTTDSDVRDAEPVWIVNDLGELGVRVGSRFFFLYKGDNLEYGTNSESRDAGVSLHDDGTPMRYRIVGKREFGEVCYPLKWTLDGRSQHRYVEELAFHKGLSFGKKEDGDWRDLPPATEAGERE